MARKETVQNGGIVLADEWKLYPLDDRNWELCKLMGDGQWRPYGRYYSHNTIDCALLYVADNLMKDKCREQAMALDAAVAEWKATIRELEQTVLESA